MNVFNTFFKFILDNIDTFVNNYGWSVVILTLLVRLVLLPLDIKSKRSMARMQTVQPQVAALQKKYANDKEKLNLKVNELYKKEKVNPLAGCLPMLLQMPILIFMFSAMRIVADERMVKLILDIKTLVDTSGIDAAIRELPKYLDNWLWIKNVFHADSFMATIIPPFQDALKAINVMGDGTLLTQENLDAARAFLSSDAYHQISNAFGANSIVYSASLLGLFTITIPAQVNGFFILPIVAGASQFLSSKFMNAQNPQQTEQQAQQNKMMQWFFPLFSVFICATSTAAFSIYWVAINVIQIIQQYLLNIWFKKQDLAKSAGEVK